MSMRPVAPVLNEQPYLRLDCFPTTRLNYDPFVLGSATNPTPVSVTATSSTSVVVAPIPITTPTDVSNTVGGGLNIAASLKQDAEEIEKVAPAHPQTDVLKADVQPENQVPVSTLNIAPRQDEELESVGGDEDNSSELENWMEDPLETTLDSLGPELNRSGVDISHLLGSPDRNKIVGDLLKLRELELLETEKESS